MNVFGKKARLVTIYMLYLAAPGISASEMSLEEVFELYSIETIQEAIQTNVISASTADNPEDMPLYVRYGAVFKNLLWNQMLHRYKFSEEDWEKMLSLPSHLHARFNTPLINSMASDCQQITAISASGTSTGALDIADILDAQVLDHAEMLNQHYRDFIGTLSAEGKAQLEMEYERVILDGGASIGWSVRDNARLARDIPEYVKTTAVAHCNYISEKLESGDWSSYEGLLVDEASGGQNPDNREDIYAPLPQNPLFTGDILHVPLVRSVNDGEVYQRAALKPIGNELWQLNTVRRSHHLLNVESVGFAGFAIDQNSPMQMLATVRGYFSSGCGGLGASVTNVDESAQTIYVDLYSRTSVLPPGEGACTANIIDYLIYQPLPVYGLPAGEYQVVVNGSYTRALTLTGDNTHAELAGSTVVTAADSSAILKGNTLQLPFVDLPDQAGQYQQIELREIDKNLWRISKIRQANLLEEIETAELVEYGDNVREIFLKVKGSYHNSCNRPGNVVSRFNNETSTLEVNFYAYLPAENEINEGICAETNEDFDFVYQLPVYAAPAGEYNVLVNGEYGLEFSLEKQNISSFIWQPFGSTQPN